MKDLWLSIWDERVLNYHAASGLSGAPPAMAVVIQPLLETSAAGVAYSVHPLTGRTTQVMINAVAGLAAALVDVGTVRVGANMTMPGMVMSGNVQVQPAGVPGRFTATAEFGMAGAWPLRIEWDGPSGRGSANFEGSVQ